jgi:hypothetical protein
MTADCRRWSWQNFRQTGKWWSPTAVDGFSVAPGLEAKRGCHDFGFGPKRFLFSRSLAERTRRCERGRRAGSRFPCAGPRRDYRGDCSFLESYCTTRDGYRQPSPQNAGVMLMAEGDGLHHRQPHARALGRPRDDKPHPEQPCRHEDAGEQRRPGGYVRRPRKDLCHPIPPRASPSRRVRTKCSAASGEAYRAIPRLRIGFLRRTCPFGA